MNKHFIQFLDKDKVVHEVQIPVTFIETGKMLGTSQIGGVWVIKYRLPDGTEPMIQMPDDYQPSNGWLLGGYRVEQSGCVHHWVAAEDNLNDVYCLKCYKPQHS